LGIKGIGEETIKDLNRIYNSLEEIEEAIEEDKLPLRNDTVEKIKDFLKNSPNKTTK